VSVTQPFSQELLHNFCKMSSHTTQKALVRSLTE
jgi:hypothetical protein